MSNIPLDHSKITEILTTKFNNNRPFDLHIFDEIDSTNTFLKNLAPIRSLSICSAEMQSQGRGQGNRVWHSPFGENIYCSSRWYLNNNLTTLSGISLVIGLSIIATLKSISPSVPLAIKWPNDIFWGSKKLGGILIESFQAPKTILNETWDYDSLPKGLFLIIGVGLNINTATQLAPLQDTKHKWCSLYEITSKKYDRNNIIATLIYYLDKYISRFQISGFEGFIEEWKQVDYLWQKEVGFTRNKKKYVGIAEGVSFSGQLIIRRGEVLDYLSSGETLDYFWNK